MWQFIQRIKQERKELKRERREMRNMKRRLTHSAGRLGGNTSYSHWIPSEKESGIPQFKPITATTPTRNKTKPKNE